MLDDEDGVAGVAEAAQDADEAVDVARVQADGRFVEDEQRADEVRAERGRERDALRLAAGERARGAVEREVARARLLEAAQARKDAVEDGDRGVAARRAGLRLRADGLEERARLRDRERVERRDVVRRAAGDEPPRARRGAQARAAAFGARRVFAVAREHHADVQLVGSALEPAEEIRHAGPQAALPVVRLAVPDPLAPLRRELLPRDVDRASDRLRAPDEHPLRVDEGLGLERLDAALGDRLAWLGDDERLGDADHAPEAAAVRARADGRVEREKVGGGLLERLAAFGAFEPRRVFEGRALRAVVRERHDERRAAAAREGRLERLAQPCAPRFLDAHRVHVHAEAAGAGLAHPREALRGEERERVLARDRGGDLDLERDDRAASFEPAADEILEDGIRRGRDDFAVAVRTEEAGAGGEELLDVVVQLGHRADRRARVADGVALADGDGGRDAVDRVDERRREAVEELPRVGRERLDVSPLPLGVDRVEHERRLPRPRHPRDDRDLPRGDVEVDAAQVVLPRPADADRLGRRAIIQLPAIGAGRLHIVPFAFLMIFGEVRSFDRRTTILRRNRMIFLTSESA